MIDVTEEKRAKAQSKSAQELLLNAIENIDEGVVLYDADDRFVLCNSQVRMHLRGLEDLLVPGTKFEDVLSAVHRNGYAEPSSGESAEELIQDALDYHANPDGSRTRRERDGRWIMINEYKTTDGGTLLVRTDITETKRREKELERAREAAETASRAKSEFLSSMSHELRTPMNAILGFAQLLNKAGERPLTDSSIRKYSGEIIKGGNHLLSLIDQVLDLAKIEAGKLSLSFESVRPADVLSECMALIGGQIGERGLILIDRTGESPMPWLWTDQARFRQVLLNLLSNAIKYNRKGGSITVTAEPQEGGFHRISVFDTGRGIPADRQSHLFEPFNRLGREAGEIEGTGIGLTISKQIVDMLGGRIGFESEEGIGSLFWIDMPIAADQFGDTDDQDDDDETEPDAAGRFSGTADQRRKVLYIEDNVSNLRLMQAVLGQMPGVSLYSAPSAEYGLDMADTEMPDLIIMDVNLPGMSGLDALLKLRASKSTRGIPVIALTEAAKPDEIEIGRKAGFKEYLTKPINIPEVLDSVRRNLN
ncbi:MAG: ATP-binding protein [Rhodospirillales bacterium]|jgi:signal transduction histidine kinase|nr:hybrid sensor histidine kinase/response regulator [Rhodospirillaceae bacterium]MDP6428956.1 ATP-binding protein [Rhodospirillales bacterium]MDP6642996.1 ATP-binding protein [Rhodospirillales bacterium]MDP6842454.1 ATP-binding protein [Rhodospirillales bacterium]|tara:strand:- start:7269 stop:8873 length:1605 start_codon:yes stop_codon:yes gene_type:complete